MVTDFLQPVLMLADGLMDPLVAGWLVCHIGEQLVQRWAGGESFISMDPT